MCGESVPRAAHAGHAELEPPYVEHVERDVMALAGHAQQVLRRHLAVVEHQRAGRRAANAQLVLLGSHLETGVGRAPQECGELHAVDLGKNRVQVGEPAVGDPHLFAVEQVVASICESVARVRMFMASEPELASDSAYAATHSPLASLGRYFRFCSSVPYQTSGSVPIPVCAPKAVEKLASTAMWSVTSEEVILSMPMPP